MVRTALIAVLATFTLASTAKAQDVADPQVIDEAEALAIDAGLYAEAYGVSREEALTRLRVMLEGGDDIAAEVQAEGIDFAGSFFDNRAAPFGLVVRSRRAGNSMRFVERPGRREFARGPERRAARAAERATLRARFRLSAADVDRAEDVLSRPVRVRIDRRGGARNGFRELANALSSAAARLNAVPGLQSIWVDQRTGEVVIMAVGVDRGPVEAVARQVLQVPFRVEMMSGGFEKNSFRGGQWTQFVDNASGQSGQYCMTGFGVRRTSDGKTGIVTAGHCRDPRYTISMIGSDGVRYNLDQGASIDDNLQGDLLFLSGSLPGSAQFRFDGTGAFRTVTGFRSRLGTTQGNSDVVAGKPSTIAGAFVCHVGRETPTSSNLVQSCGEVQSNNVYYKYNPNENLTSDQGNYVLVANTQSGSGTAVTSGTGTLRAFGGDSGGPWFAGTIAFGVHTGSQGLSNADANSRRVYALYTSVSEFNLIGVSLLVP